MLFFLLRFSIDAFVLVACKCYVVETNKRRAQLRLSSKSMFLKNKKRHRIRDLRRFTSMIISL